MLRLNLEIPQELYCPKTGNQIYGGNPEDMQSPAMLFSYTHNNSTFNHVRHDHKEWLSECLEEAKNGADIYAVFREKFESNSDLVLFCMNDSTDICIDMSYEVEIDYDDDEDDEDEEYFDDEA